SNPDRLLLLCHLAQGEKRVGELEALSGIVQPTLSQQLGVLRDEALVSTRRDGKNIHYRIDSPQAMAVMTVLYQQFCDQPKGKKR
ncbi:MAG TPA: metalloregulator ArsR/SmtB family transcription factor, partial [Ramlibacter sp.]|nr:metalloregulator ArsR/SmtB family transcription factor [Ramlibacter sp.]